MTTLKIGSINLSGPVFLAPMAGVTDMPFRSLCKEMGAAVVYSEMVSAKGLFYGGKNTEKLLVSSELEKPRAVQIFGSEPGIMSEMAKKLEQMGVELIDINMGCPAPKIVRNGEGSALMKNPALIGKIVFALSAAVEIPVTVKIRSGYDFNSINAVECAKIAQESGAAAVTVHGRTRTQQYSGTCDPYVIKAVKQALTIPVIGNGDVVSGDSAKKMLELTGCDFIMVGRASCGNPWIFKEINAYLETGSAAPPPTFEEKKHVVQRHASALAELKGERTAILEMRKHLSWYVKGIRGAGRFRSSINQIETLSGLEAILDELA